VSAIAILAVLSKSAAMRLIGGRQTWLQWTSFALRLLGGILITFFGVTLFLGALNGKFIPG
ncbi:MAG: hypothetical protein ACREDW_09395, partial [Aestuariivirgaceae bacterium]